MPVGHGGEESKHPAWVKIAILEFIEARFKDIVESDEELIGEFRAKLVEMLEECEVELSESEIERIVEKKVADYYVKVYDPFSTEMDFYILFNVDWPKYLKLYSEYYKHDTKSQEQLEAILRNYALKYPEVYTRYEVLIREAVQRDLKVDRVFNASRSKSVIFYTIEQMKNILMHGYP